MKILNPIYYKKIFSTYCESITGEITKHYYTPTYLGSNILHLGNEIKLNIPDLNSILEVEMEPNSVNFKKIVDTLKSFSNTVDMFVLKNMIVKIITSLKSNKDIKINLLDVLATNNNFEFTFNSI